MSLYAGTTLSYDMVHVRYVATIQVCHSACDVIQVRHMACVKYVALRIALYRYTT